MGIEDKLARLTAQTCMPDNVTLGGDLEGAHERLLNARFKKYRADRSKGKDAHLSDVHGHSARGSQKRSMRPQAELETPADIAQSVAMITDRNAYDALMAMGTDNPFALMRTTRYAELWSWREWQRAERPASITVELNRKIAECAVVGLVDPGLHRRAGMKGMYKACGVEFRSWKANYHDHHGCVLGQLQLLVSRATSQANKRLLKEQSGCG